MRVLDDSDQLNVDINISFDKDPISEKFVDVGGIDVVISQKKFGLLSRSRSALILSLIVMNVHVCTAALGS